MGGAVYHLKNQVGPELDVLVELGRDVGPQSFCNSGANEVNLHRVEVTDGPRHGKLHRVEIADKALQLLNGYAPLDIGYLQRLDELEALLGRNDGGTPVGVDRPSQDLLNFCPVSVPGQRLIQAREVLHLTQQVGGDLIEDAGGELGDPLFLVGFPWAAQSRSSK